MMNNYTIVLLGIDESVVESIKSSAIFHEVYNIPISAESYRQAALTLGKITTNHAQSELLFIIGEQHAKASDALVKNKYHVVIAGSKDYGNGVPFGLVKDVESAVDLLNKLPEVKISLMDEPQIEKSLNLSDLIQMALEQDDVSSSTLPPIIDIEERVSVPDQPLSTSSPKGSSKEMKEDKFDFDIIAQELNTLANSLKDKDFSTSSHTDEGEDLVYQEAEVEEILNDKEEVSLNDLWDSFKDIPEAEIEEPKATPDLVPGFDIESMLNHPSVPDPTNIVPPTLPPPLSVEDIFGEPTPDPEPEPEPEPEPTPEPIVMVQDRLQQIQDSLGMIPKKEDSSRIMKVTNTRQAKIFAAVVPKGGVGKTSLSYNLAAELQRKLGSNKKVAIIDANRGNANILSYRKLDPQRTKTLADVANQPYLTKELLKSIAYTDPACGADSYFTPFDPADPRAGFLTVNFYREATKILSQHYDYIFIDTPAYPILGETQEVDIQLFTEFIFLDADALLMIVEPLQSLIDSCLVLLQAVTQPRYKQAGQALSPEKVKIILNRYDPSVVGALTLEDVRAQFVQYGWCGHVPSYKWWTDWLNQGKLSIDDADAAQRLDEILYRITVEEAFAVSLESNKKKSSTREKTPPWGFLKKKR